MSREELNEQMLELHRGHRRILNNTTIPMHEKITRAYEKLDDPSGLIAQADRLQAQRDLDKYMFLAECGIEPPRGNWMDFESIPIPSIQPIPIYMKPFSEQKRTFYKPDGSPYQKLSKNERHWKERKKDGRKQGT